MSSCQDFLNPILNELALDNAQFPLLMFSENNCQGQMYPPVGEFNLWNQDLKENTIGFNQINSIYVPPQVVLEMWSKNQDGYYSVTGPQIISNTNAQIASWTHWDGTPCNDGEPHCNKKVNWNFNGELDRVRIVIQIPWTVMLHNFASNKQSLQMNGTVFPVNNDVLFDEICKNPQNRFTCYCHAAYQEILEFHAAAADSSYVNLLQNGCDPTTQYVPSKALVAQGTAAECNAMIQAQLETGTFPTLSTKRGQANYICANQIYTNAFNDGITDPLARIDDNEDDVLENQEMTSMTPSYAYWVVGILLLFGALLFFIYLLQRSLKYGRQTRDAIKRYRFQNYNT
jgi:hypothetical protein